MFRRQLILYAAGTGSVGSGKAGSQEGKNTSIQHGPGSTSKRSSSVVTSKGTIPQNTSSGVVATPKKPTGTTGPSTVHVRRSVPPSATTAADMDAPHRTGSGKSPELRPPSTVGGSGVNTGSSSPPDTISADTATSGKLGTADPRKGVAGLSQGGTISTSGSGKCILTPKAAAQVVTPQGTSVPSTLPPNRILLFFSSLSERTTWPLWKFLQFKAAASEGDPTDVGTRLGRGLVGRDVAMLAFTHEHGAFEASIMQPPVPAGREKKKKTPPVVSIKQIRSPKAVEGHPDRFCRKTLANFVRKWYDPQRRMFFVYGGHGQGDYINLEEYYASLQVHELAELLQGQQYAGMIFDSCCMANLDAAYHLRHNTRYIAACEGFLWEDDTSVDSHILNSRTLAMLSDPNIFPLQQHPEGFEGPGNALPKKATSPAGTGSSSAKEEKDGTRREEVEGQDQEDPVCECLQRVGRDFTQRTAMGDYAVLDTSHAASFRNYVFEHVIPYAYEHGWTMDWSGVDNLRADRKQNRSRPSLPVEPTMGREAFPVIPRDKKATAKGSKAHPNVGEKKGSGTGVGAATVASSEPLVTNMLELNHSIRFRQSFFPYDAEERYLLDLKGVLLDYEQYLKGKEKAASAKPPQQRREESINAKKSASHQHPPSPASRALLGYQQELVTLREGLKLFDKVVRSYTPPAEEERYAVPLHGLSLSAYDISAYSRPLEGEVTGEGEMTAGGRKASRTATREQYIPGMYTKQMVERVNHMAGKESCSPQADTCAGNVSKAEGTEQKPSRRV